MQGSSFSFKCPDCGAAIPLDSTTDATVVRCAHCGSTVAVPSQLRAAPAVRIAVTRVPARSAISLVGCLVPLAIIGVAFAGVWTAVTHVTRTSRFTGLISPSLTHPPRLMEPALLVPSSNGTDELIVVSRAYGTGSTGDRISAYDVRSGQPRWQQDGTYQSRIAVGAGHVFIVNKNRLTAVDRASGRVAWESALVDQIGPGCRDCLAAIGLRVVARTNDDTLQMFDSESGRTVLSRDLGRPNRVWTFGDHIVTVTADARGRETTATVIDQNGQERRRFTVTCAAADGTGALGWSDLAWVDTDAHALLAWYSRSPACVQRYDLRSGTLVWTRRGGERSSFTGEVVPVKAGSRVLMPDSHALDALSLADGTVRRVLRDDDYSFVPISATDRIALVRVRRERGTRRFELWGVDLDTARTLWRLPLPDSAPMEAPDRFIGLLAKDSDNEVFAAALHDDRVHLVRAGGKPAPWLAVETLDARTGASHGRKRIDMTAGLLWSAPSVLAWRGPTVWLYVDGMVRALDTEAGTIAASVPR